MSRRGDLGRQRWIDAATDAALRMLREGACPWAPDLTVTRENAADLGMEYVEIHWEHSGGIKAATARRAHREWDAWTREVAAAVSQHLGLICA